MAPTSSLLASALAIIAWCAIGVRADGTGMIGWGKTMYDPTCSFACRNVLRKQQLACTPTDSTENHGTSHNPVTTPPECFVSDHVFLLTMALCIDTYCPLSDKPSLAKIEDYWASHLGTGTQGDYSYVPVMTYPDALAEAREEEAGGATNTTSSSSSSEHSGHKRAAAPRLKARQHSHSETTATDGLATYNVSSTLPMTAGGSDPLTVTSFVGPTDWQLQWNYMHDFEANENTHSTVTIVITIVGVFLPIVLSLLRFVPGLTKSQAWTYWQSWLIHPAPFGRRHREPVAGVGNVPTSGHVWYILIISFLNIFLWLAPYSIHQPQASFTSLKLQTISSMANRAGVMAMGNVVVLFLFAARNNVLLHVTNWSHSTYLLLHRWFGYWAIFHTIAHSFMELGYYILTGSYESELVTDYWIWGCVATVAVSAILPFSLLWVRQRFYEVFLASHVTLAVIFIVGYYYHIWYLFEYNWGYEIWIFIPIAIWGLERLTRLGRGVAQGLRWATISKVDDTDGEYVRIEVEGKCFDGGVVYVGFPTLTWRVWETHPFSVAYGVAAGEDRSRTLPPANDKPTAEHNKNNRGTPPATATDGDSEKTTSLTPPRSHHSSSTAPRENPNTTVFYARVRSGTTSALAARASSSSAPARLRVFLEGPYHHHAGHVAPQLAHCTDMLVIAGGVGITACLPLLRDHSATSATTRLFWSSRHQGLVTALAPALEGLPGTVEVETVVGARLKLEAIVAGEMVAGSEGALAVVVCGPPAMADAVRSILVEVARTDLRSRPYVLVDEAFSW